MKPCLKEGTPPLAMRRALSVRRESELRGANDVSLARETRSGESDDPRRRLTVEDIEEGTVVRYGRLRPRDELTTLNGQAVAIRDDDLYDDSHKAPLRVRSSHRARVESERDGTPLFGV